jgi:hypothetical protein
MAVSHSDTSPRCLFFAAFYTKKHGPAAHRRHRKQRGLHCLGWIDGLTPILVLHGALLPLNVCGWSSCKELPWMSKRRRTTRLR